jgi:hypothetical protein
VLFPSYCALYFARVLAAASERSTSVRTTPAWVDIPTHTECAMRWPCTRSMTLWRSIKDRHLSIARDMGFVYKCLCGCGPGQRSIEDCYASYVSLHAPLHRIPARAQDSSTLHTHMLEGPVLSSSTPPPHPNAGRQASAVPRDQALVHRRWLHPLRRVPGTGASLPSLRGACRAI